MILDKFKLDGRVALVTGGSRGLGFEMAKALAEAGADVAITGRNRQRALDSAALIADKTKRNVLGLEANVTEAGEVAEMVQQVVDKFGRIDILINNAGVNVRGPVDDYDEADWDYVQTTNLKGPFLCARAVGPYMKKQKYGRVINVASMLGHVGLAGRAAYCASKGGLIQFTKVLALEWAPYGITVNALCPGPFATELNTPVINDPQANQMFIDRIKLNRWGEPEEIGGAAVFLASEASSFVTGTSLVIDGGWTAD